MAKYEIYKPEFVQGFIDEKWKSVSQFAISKGFNPTNGALKRASKGWVAEARRFIANNTEEAKEQARKEFVARAKEDWTEIYENLGEASVNISRKVKEMSGNDSLFIFYDKDGNEKVDIAAIKGLMEAGLNAHKLHKNTYTNTDLPLSAESQHRIEEKSKEPQGNITVNTHPTKIEIVGISPDDTKD